MSGRYSYHIGALLLGALLMGLLLAAIYLVWPVLLVLCIFGSYMLGLAAREALGWHERRDLTR